MSEAPAQRVMKVGIRRLLGRSVELTMLHFFKFPQIVTPVLAASALFLVPFLILRAFFPLLYSKPLLLYFDLVSQGGREKI